jgi:hypothetical protein
LIDSRNEEVDEVDEVDPVETFDVAEFDRFLRIFLESDLSDAELFLFILGGNVGWVEMVLYVRYFYSTRNIEWPPRGPLVKSVSASQQPVSIEDIFT